jgi:acyl-coenzyme A synthetase/AMP-(fatty) acid ligase
VEFKEGLPRTPSGKLMRRELREEIKARMAKI